GGGGEPSGRGPAQPLGAAAAEAAPQAVPAVERTQGPSPSPLGRYRLWLKSTPFAPDPFSCPKIAPDILNITKSTYNEIKPFTPSGIRDGYAQMTTRLVLAPFGYRPDATWPEAPREFFLGSRLSWYFNVLG